MAWRIRARSHGASPAMAMRIALAARGGLDARDAILGIRDALVVHAEQQLAERVLDALDVAEREIAFVELSIGDALVDDAIDHRTDRVGILLAERAYRRLGTVGEHDDPGLLALRTRAGVTVRALVGRLAALLRDLEEVLHQARAVVSGNHLADPSRKPVTVGEREAVLDVRGDDPRGHEGVELV